MRDNSADWPDGDEKSSGQLDLCLTGLLSVERRQLAGFLVGRAGQALQHLWDSCKVPHRDAGSFRSECR